MLCAAVQCKGALGFAITISCVSKWGVDDAVQTIEVETCEEERRSACTKILYWRGEGGGGGEENTKEAPPLPSHLNEPDTYTHSDSNFHTTRRLILVVVGHLVINRLHQRGLIVKSLLVITR